MDLNPWKLWTPDGKPAPNTDEIVATLETVLARSADASGREPLLHPRGRGLAASGASALAVGRRLESSCPGAGHIVHMPAHIYQRVGRYADAAEANQAAIDVDQAT